MNERQLVQPIRNRAAVDFGAPAKLYDIPYQPGQVFARGGAIYNGTLGGAIKRHMELRAPLASIGVDHGAIEGYDGGLLTPPVIWELAKRDDCAQ
jgi:hypothetical protein